MNREHGQQVKASGQGSSYLEAEGGRNGGERTGGPHVSIDLTE